MAFDDPKGLLMCQAYPTRKERKEEKGSGYPRESLCAEFGAYKQFEKDFTKRHGGGIVIGQLTYQNLATRYDPATQFILDAMQIYFRNWWSKKSPTTRNEGGFRKPDGLGIAPGGRVIEIMEVKPATEDKYYQEGVNQLNEMIKILKDGLRAYYYEQCLKTGTSVGPDPDNYISIKGCPWKPSGSGLVLPLPSNPRTEAIAWICYRPTLRDAPNGGAVSDGIILYEIHHIEKTRQQKIPDDMARRLAEAYAKQRRTASWTPFASEYLNANKQDAEFIRNLVIGLGIIAAVSVIAVAVIYAAPAVAAVAEIAPEASVATEIAAGAAEVANEAPEIVHRVRVAVEEQKIVEYIGEISQEVAKHWARAKP
jgi:hypothetical protein